MNNNKIAGDLLDIITEVVQQTTERQDKIVLCQIRNINSDGSYDVSYIPVGDGGINGILNMTKYSPGVGDYVYVLKPWNQSANAFICSVQNVSAAQSITEDAKNEIYGGKTTSGTLLDVVDGRITLGNLAAYDQVSEDMLDESLKKKINDSSGKGYITSVNANQMTVSNGRLTIDEITTDIIENGEKEVVIGEVSDIKS